MNTLTQSQPDGGGSQPQYVELEDQIAQMDYYADVPQNQTEAGGVAWADVFTQHGVKISLTERRLTGIRALDAIMQSIEYGIRKYNLSGRRPPESLPVTSSNATIATVVAAPPLQMVVDAQPKVCQVLTIKHIKSKTSTRHMLVIKTAEYPDGAMAFDNVMPKGFNINNLQLFTEYQPPADMAYCVIESKAKGPNVTEFRLAP